MQRIVILDNIRSAHNVGSIFRTADGAGVSKIFLCGYTPAPVDRFGRINAEIAKTSLGATESVLWEAREDIDALVQELQKEGVQVVAVEQTDRSVDYRTYTMNSDTAFVFGNEVDGVQNSTCAVADAVLEIPMLGKKESLNVAVSAGVILFGLLK